MSIYFIEPYNPYAPKRKKTPAEEIFEQNAQNEVIAKMMLAEAEANKTPTTPPEAPNNAQAAPSVAGGPGAGAGGVPKPTFFRPLVENGLAFSALSADAPATLTVTNPSSIYNLVQWDFGDGTTLTDGPPQTSHTYSSTGSFLVKMTSSISPLVATSSVFSSSVPTVTANFTATPTTGPVPLTVQFTAFGNNITGGTFLWLFGSGSNGTGGVASSSLQNPSFIYTSASAVYTVTLQVTGSNVGTWPGASYVTTSSVNFISASA